MRHAYFHAISAFLLTTLAAQASAFALSQPDGTVIPTGNGLQGLFDSRGEMISALNDAAILPETFIPSCGLTFTVLQRNAGYQNSFGWYNVTGQKPLDSELHEFLSCTDAVGTVKVLDIKNDPAYAGGEIAFYEGVNNCASPNNYLYVFYSQKAYNPDSNQANPFVHLLIYNSTVTKNAFYFGWEDLLSGGDNDFDDLTTYVTGITCAGGGGACDTGNPGICADGTMQCQSGVLTCVQSNQPVNESCDGLDNDCNGVTDEGDLCPANEVCDKGKCVPKCGSGEFVCASDEVCTPQGVCVEQSCASVTCPTGQVCQMGVCVGPCDNVVCPYGQVCRVGACVDPCTSISCDSGQVCVAGVCSDMCQCVGCAAGQTCQADGKCLPDGCVGKTCNAGEYCDAAGNCVDACMGAVCPSGQVCMSGQCVPGPMGQGGAGGGNGSSSGIFVGSGGSTSTSSGSGGTTGAGGSGMGGANGDSGDTGGCGCRTAGSEQAGMASLLAIAGGIGALARRRKSAEKRAERKG